jgi:hypothetical protein
MVDITFLEINVQDASFGQGDESAADGEVSFEAADETEPPGGSGSKGAVLAAFVGLAFLAVVAYLVKTRVLDEDDEADESAFEFDSDG